MTSELRVNLKKGGFAIDFAFKVESWQYFNFLIYFTNNSYNKMKY